MLSPLYYYITWVVVKITLLATYAFNAIMSLSRASTRGSYSRIEGVTDCLPSEKVQSDDPSESI